MQVNERKCCVEKPVSIEFSQRLTQIQRRLYAYVLALVPNRAEADDILQEANLVLCRKAGEYDEDGNFDGWAFRIARFQVMAYLKKRKRNRLLLSDEMVQMVAEEVEDTTRFDAMKRALGHCLDKLSPQSRSVARLRFEKEKSLLEIAEETGRPAGTIGTALFRIRQTLARCVRQRLSEEKVSEGI